uniref:SGNH domain-containing protein n=1 Tax=Panagrolaimus sp. PS1159 TaxID=55785 RepID=A0AC35G367_9BILA
MEAVSCDHPYYPCDEGIFDYIPRGGKYKPFCTYNLRTFDIVIAPQCRTADELHSKFLYFLRPDVIIFSALLSHIRELNPIAPSPEEIIKNPIYPQLQNLLRYANYTKKFILIEPNPALTKANTYFTPLSISEALIAGKDLTEYKKYIESYERSDANAWKWIQPVINECKNCKVVTTRDIFCNAKECDFIDRKSMLGLYCDEGHISPRTSFKFIPKIIDAIDN